MRRGLVFALAVPASAAVFVWAGCALVIDLGEEARLAPAEASVEPPADGAVEDASAADAPEEASSRTCGLDQSPKPSCASCIEESCCAESKACGDDPECVARFECIKDCMAQITCIIPCFENNPNVQKLTSCSSTKCQTCTPGPECEQLGKCASTFADAGEEGLLRTVARGVVLEVDEDKCKKQRASFAGYKDAEPTCTQPL